MVRQRREMTDMTNESRQNMESWWTICDADALARKDSQAATIEMITLSEALATAERTSADEVITGWALAPDERKRFDALAVIDRFQIRSVAPQLAMLLSALSNSSDPGAPFEMMKVKRILTKFGANK